jgi:hypothetical protein
MLAKSNNKIVLKKQAIFLSLRQKALKEKATITKLKPLANQLASSNVSYMDDLISSQ